MDSDNKKAIDEMLAAHRMLEELKTKDIWEIVGKQKPLKDSMTQNMEENAGVFVRRLRGRGGKLPPPKKTRKQILAEAKERRRRDALYYREHRKPRRQAMILKDVEQDSAAGWWKVLRLKNIKNTELKEGWNISLEEFKEAVGDSLKGYVPVICRYDTRKPWELHNIYIMDSSTRAIVFDGAEHKMRSLGYIL